ncbi:hypothetical protein [Pseudoalteromonas sp. T1lg24]|uniref:hypothetical protein n=1 Tax=Pseudoalteromonas sp. T1lg24 TaxID=2077099 RepID=UPI000CF73E3F|nr:hypothetical protein [Pseudoalteromonas sp. T1lg24]
MDRFEFLEHIDELNINSSAFWLNGPSNERYCLGERGNKWEVFYTERGNKNLRVEFDSESEALKHLLNKLKSDPSSIKS